MNREQTLKQAGDIILKDREKTHGAPEDSFALIAKFWSAYLGVEIKDYQVGLMMSLLKIARLKYKPLSEDGYLDLVGYGACSAELAEKYPVPESFWKKPLTGHEWDKILKDVQIVREINSHAPLPSSVLHEA